MAERARASARRLPARLRRSLRSGGVSLRSRLLDDAVGRANRVDYGLHAAIFTESLRDAFHAVRHLHVGGVIVNDSTDYRLDIMPFGGTKLSGIGREGIRFALKDMTETRVVCFNL